jgi:excisionase family DNA binding protein
MKPKTPAKIPLSEKLALTIPEAADLSNVCKSVIYEAVQSRELPAKKRGRSTLILQTALKAWVEGFEDFAPSPPRTPRHRAAHAARGVSGPEATSAPRSPRSLSLPAAASPG